MGAVNMNSPASPPSPWDLLPPKLSPCLTDHSGQAAQQVPRWLPLSQGGTARRAALHGGDSPEALRSPPLLCAPTVTDSVSTYVIYLLFASLPTFDIHPDRISQPPHT